MVDTLPDSKNKDFNNVVTVSSTNVCLNAILKVFIPVRFVNHFSIALVVKTQFLNDVSVFQQLFEVVKRYLRLGTVRMGQPKEV